VLILKHKLLLDNAYFKAKYFNAILSAPKEELYRQLLHHGAGGFTLVQQVQ
jgi:hypothetical protein